MLTPQLPPSEDAVTLKPSSSSALIAASQFILPTVGRDASSATKRTSPPPKSFTSISPRRAPSALESHDESWPWRARRCSAPRREPAIAASRPYMRIEDPSVSEEPLFPEIAPDERRQKNGLLSLFGGRRRHEAPYPEARAQSPAPVPQARSVASAQPAEEPRVEDGEDLEIPSFLRRLAN